MTLSQSATNILDQLAELVNQIHESDYKTPSGILNGATIGAHIRHTIEFFICLENGYNTGVINYDKRRHDKLMEEQREVALTAIESARRFVMSLHPDKELKLEVGYDAESEQYVEVATNAGRELVYNIEHAVHHMAIIRIGITHAAPYVKIGEDFGIAASTLRYAASGLSPG